MNFFIQKATQTQFICYNSNVTAKRIGELKMNFTKLTAAALAAGMALTAAPVFAAYSPDAADKPAQDVNFEVNVKDKENAFEVGDNTYVIEEKDTDDYTKAEKNALESVTTDEDAAKNRKDIIKAAGYDVTKFDTTVVLGSGVYELVNDETNEVVNKLPGDESFTLSFKLDDASKENFAGKNIFVMHFNDTTKAWEVQNVKVDKKGNFNVKLNNLSPLAFVGALGWEGKDGFRPAINAPKADKTYSVGTDNGNRPEGGYTTGSKVEDNTNGGASNGTTNGGANGGSVNAGSTVANKVSPNTAA